MCFTRILKYSFINCTCSVIDKTSLAVAFYQTYSRVVYHYMCKAKMNLHPAQLIIIGLLGYAMLTLYFVNFVIKLSLMCLLSDNIIYKDD